MASSFIPTPVFSLSDTESLTRTDLTCCWLLLSASVDHLHYAVFHPEQKKFIYLKGYYFNPGENVQNMLSILEKCFDADKIIFTDFKAIKIIFDNPFFTFIPDVHYDNALKKDYFSLLIPSMENHKIHQDVLGADGMVNVYSVNKYLMGYLKKEFGHGQYFHAETVFLQSVLGSFPPAADRVYVRMASERVTVTVLAKGRLHLSQSYPIKHSKDALFYTLNAIHQFGLAPDHVGLFLTGEVESDASVFRELHHEVPKTAWLDRPAGFDFIKPFSEYPAHYFYNLTALAACG